MLGSKSDSNSLYSKIENLIKEIKQISPSTKIMAVIKYADENDILNMLETDKINIIGESKIQQALRWEKDERFKKYRDKIELHFIGHLQTNKIKYAVRLFDYIDSIDSLELASKLNNKLKELKKKMPVLLQLKINNSPTQYGIKPEEFDNFYREISEFEYLSPSGIMAIGPNTENENEIRKAFKKASEIYRNYFKSKYNRDGFKNYLSIGMSGDYKIAIEEGSNLIRIGSLIFS